MTVRDIYDALACENRADRRMYDEQHASTVRHPNGSLIASFDRAFLAAALRHTLVAYGVDLNPPTTEAAA